MFIFLMVFFGGLLLISFGCELIGGSSFTGLFVDSNKCVKTIAGHVLAVVNADAVLKVAEAIGLSSIPIACIYASLDQVELGFRYRELLKVLYPYYSVFVVIHLLSVLCCMWFASAKLLEPALLMLGILLLGCLLQWQTMKNLLLSSKTRRGTALTYWKKLVRENKDDEIDYIRLVVLRMADAIPVSNDKGYKEVLETFSVIICEFVQEWDNATNTGQAKPWDLLQQIQNIWKHLLIGKESHEQFLFAAELLKQCAADSHYDLICAGYVLCLCEEMVVDFAETKEVKKEEALNVAANVIVQLVEREFSVLAAGKLYLETSFTLLVWMRFLAGQISLDEGLLDLSPSREGEVWSEERLRLVAQAISNGDPEQNFDLVKDQIYR